MIIILTEYKDFSVAYTEFSDDLENPYGCMIYKKFNDLKCEDNFDIVDTFLITKEQLNEISDVEFWSKKYIDDNFEELTEISIRLHDRMKADIEKDFVAITKNNVYIVDELLFDDISVNACIAAEFDIDKRFNISTKDTDDYVNIYANYYPNTQKFELSYVIKYADGKDKCYSDKSITQSEIDLIKELMNEKCNKDCGMDMHSAWKEFEEENEEDWEL